MSDNKEVSYEMVPVEKMTPEMQKVAKEMGHLGLFATFPTNQQAYDYAMGLAVNGQDTTAFTTAIHCVINTMVSTILHENVSLKTPRKMWYFSFGHGQNYFGTYMAIFGTYEEARTEMFNRVNDKFCMQYESLEDIGAEKWGLEELEWPQK